MPSRTSRFRVTPPQLPDTYLVREQATALLRRQPPQPITVVTAAAGHGKTSLVAHGLQDAGHPVVWVGLQQDDGAEAAFLRVVLQALSTVGRQVPDDVKALSRSDAAGWQGLLSAVIDTLVEQTPTTVVLDDLHQLEDQPALAVVRQLIEETSDAIRYVLITRHEIPGLGLAGWRLQGRVGDIGEEQLRLRPDESDQLLASLLGRRLPAESLAAVQASCGGWVAGLILAGHALQRGDRQAVHLPDLQADSPEYHRFLCEEVLDELPQALRRFMVRASLLPEITATDCRDAWGEADGAAMLAELRRRHLFLEAAGSGRYSFHPLMRACLQKLARTELSDDDRARILTYGARTEDLPTAIHLSLGLERRDDWVRLMQRLAGDAFWSDSPAQLQRLIDTIPAAHRAGRWGQLVVAQLRRVQGRHAETLDMLADIAAEPDPLLRGTAKAVAALAACSLGRPETVDLAEAALAVLPPSGQRVRAVAYNVLGSWRFERDDLDGALRAFEQARQAAEAVGDARNLAKAQLNVGNTYLQLGRLEAGETQFRTVLAACRAGGHVPPLLLYHNWSVCAQSRGDLRRALALAEEGLSLAQALVMPQVALKLRSMRAGVLMGLGQLELADADLRYGEEQAGSDVFETFRTRLNRAEWWRLRHDSDRAWQHCQQALTMPAASPYWRDRLWVRACVAKAALALGRLELAEGEITAMLAQAESHGMRWWQAKALALQARLADVRGDADSPHRLQQQIRDIGAANGFAEAAVLDLWSPSAQQVATLEPIIDIRCFGPFQVRLANGSNPFSGIQGVKPKMLLAMLLLEPEGLSREALTERLYGDQDVGKNALIMMVSRLRKALTPDEMHWPGGGLLIWHEGRYRLNPDLRIGCDLQAFEAAWQASQTAATPAERRAAWETMVSLYRGRLFAEFPEPVWALLAHDRTRRQWQEAVLGLAGLAEPAAALEVLDPALGIDPVCEPFHRAKLALLRQLDRQAELCRHLTTMARIWQDQLGVAFDPAQW